MTSAPFDYRFRYFLHTLIYILAFIAPWDYWLHLDARFHTTWEWAATHLSDTGILHAGPAFIAFLVAAILFTALGAILRTWGTAYLTSGIVQSPAMHSDSIVADGPFRYVRNPLYLGTFLHTVGLALIMPPSGAAFAIVLIGLYQLRLIAVEEPYLAATLGQRYLDYRARVPAILPALTPQVSAGGARPRWPQAMLGEIYMIAIVVAFAVFGWQYDSWLLIRCVLIALGISLIARAIKPRTT